MKTEQNQLSYYLENVRYFCDPDSLLELNKVLSAVYDQVSARQVNPCQALLSALDLNVRQLLKNILAASFSNLHLPEFQKVITLSQSLIKRSENHQVAQEYIIRWQFANDVIQDRKHELSVDSHRLLNRPQVKLLLQLLARKEKTKRETIEAELGIKKQRASNLLGDLKVLSLIVEFKSEQDRRMKAYALTETGKEKARQIGIDIPSIKKATRHSFMAGSDKRESGSTAAYQESSKRTVKRRDNNQNKKANAANKRKKTGTSNTSNKNKAIPVAAMPRKVV